MVAKNYFICNNKNVRTKGDKQMEKMKSENEQLRILKNERALVAIYLREFNEKKMTKKHFIEVIARTLRNTEEFLKA